MSGSGRFLAAQPLIVRVGTVCLVFLAYALVFPRLYAAVGSAAFLASLLPCIVGGLLLGLRGALVVILATIVLDRAHAIAIGLPPGPALVAAIMSKLFFGLGAGALVEHTRRLRELNARLNVEVKARAKTERQLGESEELYRALVHSLGEGVGLFDAEGRFVFANRAFADLLELTPEQLLGRHLAEFVDDESYKQLEPKASDQSRRTYEISLRTQRQRLLLVTETRLEHEVRGRAGVLRVMRDLTERVEREQHSRKLELELERSQALQGLAVLAGGVAHDFNNLLSGVVGNAEFASMKLPENASPKLVQCLEEIKTYAGEATQLSRQMLAYAGRHSLSMRPIDVNAEITEALKLLRSTLASHASLQLHLDAELPSVNADPFQLRQVLTNLLLNAAEAMDRGRGQITLSTRLVDLTPEKLGSCSAPAGALPGNYVALSVTDTGSGIEESAQQLIFQPYYSTKAQGRGMGLAAATGIARTHRGWIQVASKPGEGTRFTLWLPESREPLREQRPSPVNGTQSLPMGCVLLIDDEPAVRLVTRRLLSEMGQEVMTADSGKRGLRLFRERHAEIDIVLLDLTMPDLSGAEVLTELCKIDPEVQVILTSGFQPSGSGELLSVRNVVGFLEKPHTLANLEAVLGLSAPVQQSPAVRSK